MANIAINGFGRIGRVVFRILQERKRAGLSDLNVVAINDLSSLDTLAHLLKYDSVHGRYTGVVSIENEALVVDGKKIAVSAERDPKNLPWRAQNVDVVLESTGMFCDRAKSMQHIDAGAKKVLISAPVGGTPPDATVCFGVNTSDFTPEMQVVSTASCTTNCIAPVARVLQDNWGIKRAFVTTVHSYTNDQKVLDLPHKDLRRARAAALSMIPTTTGAAKAIALVMPELEGKFDGMAIRVPTPTVSCIDLVAELDKNASAESVNSALRDASLGDMKGILGYTDEPLVSADMIGTNESSIVDGLVTKVLDGNLVKVLSWYDNEWGFANRACDLLKLLASAST